MIYTLQIHENVFWEVKDAVDYYDFIQEGLGRKLISDWEATLLLISKYPLSFQTTQRNYRQILLQKFPYLINYEVEGSKINVYKFINAKKHPSKRYK